MNLTQSGKQREIRMTTYRIPLCPPSKATRLQQWLEEVDWPETWCWQSFRMSFVPNIDTTAAGHLEVGTIVVLKLSGEGLLRAVAAHTKIVGPN